MEVERWAAGMGVVRESEASVVRVGWRKYVSNLRPGMEREWFAGLRWEGEEAQVALGTEEANTAWMRAREMEAELRRVGWRRFRLGHACEVTVAVFWSANPMACTYTTLTTVPVGRGSGEPELRVGTGILGESRVEGERMGRRWRVVIVESDGGVRRALLAWVGRHCEVVGLEDGVRGVEGMMAGSCDVVLVNREQAVGVWREWAGRTVRVLTYGVFADSDAIFASFSGVSEGYCLRRVAPEGLLEPLTVGVGEGGARGVQETERGIRRYFQGMFDTTSIRRTSMSPELSAREAEVLEGLSRGLADKELARDLGISIWTVHSHLKRIFGKYGVRTRTEAVVRYLQK
jgi:DNA-binding NarL/FixJ family response regulator